MRPELLNVEPVVCLPVNHQSWSGNYKQLCCPRCGSHYVHIAQVEIEQGHVRTEVTDDQVQVHGSSRHDNHRGSAVTLAFYCENGDWFEYRYEFDHGHTAVQLLTARVDQAGLSELWRN